MAVATPTSIAKAKITVDASTATISGITRTSGMLYILFIDSKTEITANPNQPTASGTGVTFIVPTNGTAVYDNSSSSRRRVTGMYAVCTSTSSADITIAYGSQTQVTQIYDLIEIASGFNSTTPVPQAAQNSSPSSSVSSITATLAAFIDANSITIGGFGSGNGSDTYTVGSGFSLINNQQDTVEGNLTLLTEYVLGNDTTVDVSCSPSQSEIGIVAMEIAATVATSSIKTINGLARASVKTVNGLAIASVKTVNGLA